MGEGEVVAEGEAGEEVDMETTKGVMKEKTKGTIKKIIKVLFCHRRRSFRLMVNICYCLFSLLLTCSFILG